MRLLTYWAILFRHLIYSFKALNKSSWNWRVREETQLHCLVHEGVPVLEIIGDLVLWSFRLRFNVCLLFFFVVQIDSNWLLFGLNGSILIGVALHLFGVEMPLLFSLSSIFIDRMSSIKSLIDDELKHWWLLSKTCAFSMYSSLDLEIKFSFWYLDCF
jgi:hypothetical protein